jgi:hypothetical protein
VPSLKLSDYYRTSSARLAMKNNILVFAYAINLIEYLP